MSVIKSAIFTIYERFSDRKDTVKRLFNASDEFQTLCDDFRQCCQALEYWNQSIKADAPARRQEYKALRRELEDEINRLIDEAELKADP
jgi:hypothetical protein